jgi:archaellum biogenesis ATPase FlaH
MTNEFLSDLFDGQEGIVYSPIKGDTFKQYFFEWPQERSKLEDHLKNFHDRDVYLSPVLFSAKRISPETFKGTNYLWTEFDGTIPNDAIEPTMRVMSSQEGHEHWYWKLDKFVTDKVQIEDLTRRIAYHYGADLSVWDYQNVLRPVDTWNHKRNKPVTLVSRNDNTYTIDHFLWVPIPPAGTKVSISTTGLPSRDEILAKYKWKFDALDLLFKEVPKGRRSDALARLAHEAAEVGCSNEEIYVLLEERDSVWGKFVGRTDRQKRLEALIATIRGKRVITAEIVQGTTEVYRYMDFMNTNVELKWAIEGLLPVAGSMVIFGKPGIGKSTYSLRLAMSLSLGDDYFLDWKIVNPQRTLFISLEMQHDELKEFFKDMNISEERSHRLQENFFVWPVGHAYPLDTPDQQIELLKYIKMHKIELLVIDSLSLSMYGDVSNDNDVKRLNSFLNEDVRKDLKCGYIFIHHPRKAGIDTSKEKNLDDAFGSIYITANAQSVIILSQKPGSPRLHVKMDKTRMSKGEKEFDIERTNDRGFTLVGSNSTPTTILAIGSGETSSNKEPDAHSLGKMFGL